MSDHVATLVPLETATFSAPELADRKIAADLGLVCEALVFYDRVYVAPTTPAQFMELVRWFVRRGALTEFLALLAEGTIRILYHAFETSVISVPADPGVIHVYNTQTEEQRRGGSFEPTYLYNRDFERLLPLQRDRVKVYRALRQPDTVVEVSAAQCSRAVENAREDFADSRRYASVVQHIANDVYRLRGVPQAPQFSVSVEQLDRSKRSLTWRPSFREVDTLGGPSLPFLPITPVVANLRSNKYLWSAALHSLDLYLASPLSHLTGDKLFESVERAARLGKVIDTLKVDVEFPDIRRLVNDNRIGLSEVLKLRDKGHRFRSWLRQEADRDRDAVHAYLNETAREAGYRNTARSVVRMFGFIGAPLAGAMVTERLGPFAGSLTTDSAKYMVDVVTRIGEGWRPVVFGNWAQDHIAEWLRGEA